MDNQMNYSLACFIPYANTAAVQQTVENLRPYAGEIFLMVNQKPDCEPWAGCQWHVIPDGQVYGSENMKLIVNNGIDHDYIMVYEGTNTLVPGPHAIERMVGLMAQTAAPMAYSDYAVELDGVRSARPVADYQEGSVRNDFRFGPLMVFDTDAMVIAQRWLDQKAYKYAGLYAMRLALSIQALPMHINEPLYTVVENSQNAEGAIEKQFEYVNPRFRDVQIEMEEACTQYLKDIDAYIEPGSQVDVDINEGQFPVEASVIIPVRNRIRTICDAVDSALSQKTDFKMNVIVVDNHSTDGTAEALAKYADPRLVVITPERNDLGIGGCWNLAIDDPRCGRFAIQLDSDDVYSDEHTAQKIVDKFRETKAAMVIGTYHLTNFDKEKMEGGLIDHAEWTDDNGTNNALRINGLGAPRAFFTPVLRQIHLPNTSYGEDYAVGIAITRDYKLGRIYDVLYYCRRWDDNSDNGVQTDYERLNRFDTYKDRIRTWEIAARIWKNEMIEAECEAEAEDTTAE